MNAHNSFSTQAQHVVPHFTEAGDRFSWDLPAVLANAGFAAFLLISAPALAQVAPPLGTVAQFATISAAGLVGQAGNGARVAGSVGSNTAISNFPPSAVVPAPGRRVFPVGDPVVAGALNDANTAFNFLVAQGPGTVLSDNLGIVGPLTSGIFSTTTGAADLPAGAVLVLNGPGIFVFNVDSLTANVLSSIAGTANPCNVFFSVQSSATLNGNNFFGTVIALASVTIGDVVGPLVGTNLQGRAVGLTGAVTLAGDGGTTVGGCSAALAFGGTRIPTLSEWALILLATITAGMGLLAMRKRRRPA